MEQRDFDLFSARLLEAKHHLEKREGAVSGAEIARRSGAVLKREAFSSGWFSQLAASDTAPPIATSLAVALVCGVDAGWLMCGPATGAGIDATPETLEGMRAQLAIYVTASKEREIVAQPATHGRTKVNTKQPPSGRRRA